MYTNKPSLQASKLYDFCASGCAGADSELQENRGILDREQSRQIHLKEMSALLPKSGIMVRTARLSAYG